MEFIEINKNKKSDEIDLLFLFVSLINLFLFFYLNLIN